MFKKIFIMLILISIVLFISLFSFKEEITNSSIEDITELVDIDGNTLEVLYKEGNLIDELFSYGNKITKEIILTNTNDIDLSYAILLTDIDLTDKNIKYNFYYSYDGTTYNKYIKEENVNNLGYLSYNLVVEKNSKMYIKIELINNMEEFTFNAKLSVVSNISESEIFANNIYKLHNSLLSKIDSLNGINEKGIFILDVSSLVDNLKGYIVLDATDYSNIEYYYYVYDDNYLVNNYKYENSKINKSSIKNKDESIISNFTYDTICSNYSKNGCRDFYTLTVTTDGGEKNFKESVNNIYENTKNSFNKTNKQVYITSVNENNVHGYILIDNTKDTSEYYLYLTNNIYMICGYNITKLGDIDIDSTTIRAYNETSFNNSSSSYSSVCTFTGFTECYNLQDERV